MPPPPPRRRFQIHLSTAIVLMFVAGGLMWANVRYVMQDVPMGIIDPQEPNSNLAGSGPTSCNVRVYGWPALAIMYSPTTKDIIDIGYSNGNYYPILAPLLRRSLWGICLNAITALAIFFFVWFILESLIRRRSSKKGP